MKQCCEISGFSTVRPYGHSNHVGGEGGEPDEAGKVGGFLFVAGRHAAAAFNPAEEAFDLIAMLINRFVIALLHLATGVGLDAHFGFQSLAAFANRVGIIRGVSDDRSHRAHRELIEQRFSLRSIAALAGGEDKVDQRSVGSRHGMNLRRQPAPAASEAATVVRLTFFSCGSRRPVEAT